MSARKLGLKRYRSECILVDSVKGERSVNIEISKLCFNTECLTKDCQEMMEIQFELREQI